MAKPLKPISLDIIYVVEAIGIYLSVAPTELQLLCLSRSSERLAAKRSPLHLLVVLSRSSRISERYLTCFLHSQLQTLLVTLPAPPRFERFKVSGILPLD